MLHAKVLQSGADFGAYPLYGTVSEAHVLSFKDRFIWTARKCTCEEL